MTRPPPGGTITGLYQLTASYWAVMYQRPGGRSKTARPASLVVLSTKPRSGFPPTLATAWRRASLRLPSQRA